MSEDEYERNGKVYSSYQEFRMLRNRESAARSRQNKRDYVTSLERQVDELLGMVEVLRAQNWYLQTSKPVAVTLEDALCPEWEAMGGYLCLDVE